MLGQASGRGAVRCRRFPHEEDVNPGRRVPGDREDSGDRVGAGRGTRPGLQVRACGQCTCARLALPASVPEDPCGLLLL